MGGACRGVCKFCFDLGLGIGCGSVILKGVCVCGRGYMKVCLSRGLRNAGITLKAGVIGSGSTLDAHLCIFVLHI